MLRISTPWDSQPQEAVGVDWGNPLAVGLLDLALPDGAGGFTPVIPSTSTFAKAGSPQSGIGRAGRVTSTTTTSDNWSAGPADTRCLAGGTVLAFYNKRDTTNRSSSMFGAGGGAGTSIFNAHAPFSDGTTYWDFGGNSGNNRVSIAGLDYSKPTCLVFAAGAGGSRIVQDGIVRASKSVSISRTASATGFFFGRGGVTTSDLVDIYMVAVWSRELSELEARTVSANPWALFTPRSIWVPVSAATGGASGTVAYTNANDTSSASGTTTVTGTLARSNTSDTSAASGTTTIVGTLATTNASDASAASGTTTVLGTLAQSNADDTAAASGSVGSSGSTGTVNATNANDTSAAAGATTVTGTVARSNTSDSASASGWAGLISGTVSASNASDTSAASGSGGTAIVQVSGGGIYPTPRRKTKQEIDEDRKRLGILPDEPEIQTGIVETPKRPKITLEQLIGKPAADTHRADMERASAAHKLRKRRQDDDLLMMM